MPVRKARRMKENRFIARHGTHRPASGHHDFAAQEVKGAGSPSAPKEISPTHPGNAAPDFHLYPQHVVRHLSRLETLVLMDDALQPGGLPAALCSAIGFHGR